MLHLYDHWTRLINCLVASSHEIWTAAPDYFLQKRSQKSFHSYWRCPSAFWRCCKSVTVTKTCEILVRIFGGLEFGLSVACNICCGGAEYVSVFDIKKTGKCRKKLLLEPNPFMNDKYVANVLIIQKKRAGDPNSCPDDSDPGGSITFEFFQPVFFQTGERLDIDVPEQCPACLPLFNFKWFSSQNNRCLRDC
jgi:hypothetical protein